MDGGSGLNILYANTLELLELDQSRLRGGSAPFHGVVPGKRTQPLGRVDLPVCFGTPSNYRKEALTFECIEYAEAIVEAETLIADLDQLGSKVPDVKRRAGTFEPAEAVKVVPVDPTVPDGRGLKISATLNSK
ncbi:uncharacterized protein [Miscanthus floridulus]|uniref:uncharacterized protein n=1 Tax=Miscanthus floridulus TaxID=154761 RepID=UPI003458A8C1